MSFRGGPTMFGRVPEKNVYFLIDTSGSMYHQLEFVKEHLVAVLVNRASISQDSMFNIIEFKEDVDKWADRLVQCTPAAVDVAARWINKLKCGTSTNTMTALLEAFNDRAVEAVYMVTDGLPDQRPTVILEKLKTIPYGVPVHCIYLNGAYSDPAARDFLRDLAEQTRGSFHTVTLTYNGRVEQAIPVYNANHAQKYDNSVSFNSSVPSCLESKPYIDMEKPPASGYVTRIYDKYQMPVTAVNTLVPLPHLLHKDGILEQRSGTLDSKVFDYVDAVIKARGLAKSVGVRCCSTPVASSLMKGIKVLARNDQDGLYYFGQVTEQGPHESFTVKFESCPAMRKPVVRDISVYHMIAYKDAIRSHVSVGDKVLAPWQPDGRYGPGTVLDGVDRRDPQPDGYDGGQVLVTFFNGETAELQPGVAVRISQDKFDRIVRELQLPESQRRKLKLNRQNIPPKFDDVSRTKPGNAWQEVSTRAWEDERTKKGSDRLREKVDAQINENNYLLNALDLNGGTRNLKVIGKATSRDIPGYDSGVFSDDESETSDDESRIAKEASFRNSVDIKDPNKEYDLEHFSRFTFPEGTVLSKSGGKVEDKKRWRWWSTGVPVKQPRFRETLLEKPREPGEKMTNTVRPGHEEYQTVAGVSFPAGTDRKFALKSQKWHPYRQFGSTQKENVSVAWQRKHLKHSEYQDVTGVRFPSATDKKFTRSLDPNWRPETAMMNAVRSQNWEDGLGHGDAVKDARYADKLERKRESHRRYFKDIEDKVAVTEAKEAKKTEFRRNKMMQRSENLAEVDAEKRKIMTQRTENKTARQAEILKSEKERTEKAEKWKSDRIDAKRNRQAKYLEMEENSENEKEARVALRQAHRRQRETERREDFHERLRQEWRAEDERAEFLRQKSEERREITNKRGEDAEKMKQARFAAKQDRLVKYRASILP